MYLKEGYEDRLLQRVEDLASRIHVLRGHLAKQTFSVKLEQFWELRNVRSLFTEFKRRVEQLEEDDDLQLQHDQEAIDATWSDLMHAVDILLAALP